MTKELKLICTVCLTFKKVCYCV